MPPPDDRTARRPADRTAAIPAPTSASRTAHTEIRPYLAPAPAAPGMPIVPGYVVLREVGRGGMGAVYAAHDPTFNREVAVKVMHPGHDAGRFVVEARVTAQLPHPGVPPVHALGTLPDGRPFLAMKLIGGRTLAVEMNDPDGDLSELLTAFERVCEAVGFAHSKGIVHRDLKPSNVMVGAFGEVLVLDWGLAKGLRIEDKVDSSNPQSAIRNPQSHETTAGSVKGTPAYMAPEQARGEEVDARADVFALGGILAAILTGKPPFMSETVLATVMQAAQADLRDCFARLDRCDEDAELVTVAKRCLAAAPADRFASGEQVADAIADYRVGVEARLRQAERERAVAAAEAREQQKRRKVQRLLAGALLLLVCGAAAATVWQMNQRATNAQKALKDAADRKYQTEQAERTVRDALALALDLRKQGRFTEADVALDQALPAAFTAGGDAPALIDGARADTRLVGDLDTIRYQKWEWRRAGSEVSDTQGRVAGVAGSVRGSTVTLTNRGEFDDKQAPGQYRAAFLQHGFAVDGDPAALAAAIRASGAGHELVAALDDWAVHEPDTITRAWLLDAARRADPHPWRDRFRDPTVWTDPVALRRLAETADPTTAPAHTIAALALVMGRAGLDPSQQLVAARAAHPTDFELAFSLGLWYARGGGEFERQVGPYEAARAIRPNNYSARNNLGVAYLMIGDRRAAVTIFRENTRLTPNSARAFNNLGSALNESGDFAASAVALREAIRLDPEHAGAFDNLGSALRQAGPIGEALRMHRRACELDPKNSKYRGNLAAALRIAGDTPRAIATYHEAIALDPQNALARNNLAVVFKEIGRPAEAVQQYKAALMINPKYAPAHNNLGNVYLDAGDIPAALAEFRAAVRLDPKLAVAHSCLGNALQAAGDLDGALRAHADAIRNDPTYATAYNNLGNVLHAKRDFVGALKAYDAALRLNPNFATTHFNRGNVLRDSGDVSGAIAAFRQTIKLVPNFSGAHNNLGLLLDKNEATRAEAFERFEEAIRLDKRNGFAHSNLAGALYRQGKYAAAIESAQASLDVQPTNSQSHAVLGLSRLKLGDTAGARAALTEAARLDPKAQRHLELLPQIAPPPREVNRP